MKTITDVGSVKDMLLRTYFHPDCFKLAIHKSFGSLKFKTQVSIDNTPTDVIVNTLCYGRKYDRESLHRGDNGDVMEFINIVFWCGGKDPDSQIGEPELLGAVGVKVKYQMIHDNPEEDYHASIKEFELYPDLFTHSADAQVELSASMLGTIVAGAHVKKELLAFKEAADRTPELEVSNSDISIISRTLDEIQFDILEKYIEITNRQPLKE